MRPAKLTNHGIKLPLALGRELGGHWTWALEPGPMSEQLFIPLDSTSEALRGEQFGPAPHQFSSQDGHPMAGCARQCRECRHDRDGALPLGPHSQLQRRDRMLPVVMFTMAVAVVP